MSGDGFDPVIDRAPEAAPAPLVYDSPHSGRAFPAGFAPAVDPKDLAGYEDRLVDDLVADAPAAGVRLIAARFPRAYVDPNRAPDDLDPALVGGDWDGPLAPSPLSERGVGLVFAACPEGRPLYAEPPGRAAIEVRIARCWRPYHDALDDALDEAHARHGRVFHISWHSMRPAGAAFSPDPGARRPDFVLGDLDGTSADPAFVDMVEGLLRAQGHSAARNAPFRGGYITARHGRPAEGRHSLQIEINRALYLDMETLEKGPGFNALRRDLSDFTDRLATSL